MPLIQKIIIENLKFNLSTRICEMRKKRKNAKLFASIRSTNSEVNIRDKHT